MTTAAIDWSALAREGRDHFGIQRFRPGQREIIEGVLGGRDVVGTMPTGAGKSLCYQLPALMLPKATVVVSPLISLMQDQHEKLSQADVASSTLNSTLSASEERQAVVDIRSCIDWLETQGYEQFGVLGTSLGSCYAFIAAAHDPRIARLTRGRWHMRPFTPSPPMDRWRHGRYSVAAT